MHTTTREAFTKVMEDIVADIGEDYIYEAPVVNSGFNECVYFHKGQPSCIIGQALSRLGVARGEVREGNLAATVLCDLGVHDQGLLAAVDCAQGTQDAFYPWGEALANYKKALDDNPILASQVNT